MSEAGEVALAAAAVGTGGMVQSATGFGYAIVAAPILTAAHGPFVTAPTLTVLGLLVNVLTLAGERRRPTVTPGVVAPLVAWSIPGLILGSLLLKVADADVLRLAVAGAVLIAVLAHVVSRAQVPVTPREAKTPEVAGAGFLSGAFGQSTGIGGPPLVLHLLRRGINPDERRDTLAALFLAGGTISIAVFVLTGTLDLAPHLGLLALATATGQLLGRKAFTVLEPRHEPVTIAVLLLGVAGAAVPAVQALT